MTLSILAAALLVAAPASPAAAAPAALAPATPAAPAAPPAANPAAPAAAGPAAAVPASGPLFPVQKGGKWGFIDRAGQVVIPLELDRAERFSEGLAAVVQKGRHGWMDGAGRLAVESEAQPAGPVHRAFHDGRAAVRAGERLGYVDREGKLAIPARFTSAEDFSGGYAFVCDEASCGYVDRGGRAALAAGLLEGRPVRNGIAAMAVRLGRGQKRWVLHDLALGRLPGDYDDVGSFSEGLVAVRHEGRWGYVDGRGAPAVRPRFARAGEFVGGLAPVFEQAWTCGYADRSGKLVVPARFRFCWPFSEGRARVEVLGPDPKVPLPGFIDVKGELRVEGRTAQPPFRAAADFADGLAAVEARAPDGATLRGWIDRDGKYVWPPSR